MTPDLADDILGPVAVRPGNAYHWQKDPKAPSIAFTIYGQPFSKSNRRRPAFVGKGENRRMIFIKSEEALAYEADALLQIPSQFRARLEGPVRITMRIWYASELPDLDESIVLDILQDRWSKQPSGRRELVQRGVYRNDRQVREKHVFHGIDRTNPRVEILVEPLTAQQIGLL